MKRTNKIKTAISLDADVCAKMKEYADRNFGGNFSAAVERAMWNELEISRGSTSKVFQFSAEVASVLRALGLITTNPQHAVDWIVPSLRLGIEVKVKFTPGKAESAAVASMAYTVGQQLCSEIWIVAPEAMTAEDRTQWERVAREFHLCRARFILAGNLESELRIRIKNYAQ